MELLEWELGKELGSRFGKLRDWEARFGCLKIWDAAVEMEPPHTGSSRGAAHPVWQLPWVRHVDPGGPKAGAQPGAVITPAAPSLVSWNRKSA